MPSFNKTILMGHLTRNPELRYTPSGTAVAKFGLAVNKRFKQGDDLKEKVTFIDITCFGKQAEHCAEFLQKGSAALVEGELEQQLWESKTGEKRSKHEVIAQHVTFMGKKGEASEEG